MVLNHLVIFLLDSKSPGGATLTRGSINLLQNFRHYSYQPENVELESLIDLTLLTIMPLFSAEVKNLKFSSLLSSNRSVSSCSAILRQIELISRAEKKNLNEVLQPLTLNYKAFEKHEIKNNNS